ncbi:MAG TPA: hypothetical protein VG937_30370 [Polyangiaceae bacterium]|nr:hypothetical protein [Polyangiaceae bacterium]
MKTFLHTRFAWLPLLLASAACSVASAADTSSATNESALAETGANGQRPHRPPQAAFDACKGATEGASCSVTFRDRTVDGTCRKGPNGEDELACVPAHPPGPPPEAVEACTNASEGAACRVTFRGDTWDGTCRKGPHGESVLACMPDRLPAPPE